MDGVLGSGTSRRGEPRRRRAPRRPTAPDAPRPAADGGVRRRTAAPVKAHLPDGLRPFAPCERRRASSQRRAIIGRPRGRRRPPTHRGRAEGRRRRRRRRPAVPADPRRGTGRRPVHGPVPAARSRRTRTSRDATAPGAPCEAAATGAPSCAAPRGSRTRASADGTVWLHNATDVPRRAAVSATALCSHAGHVVPVRGRDVEPSPASPAGRVGPGRSSRASTSATGPPAGLDGYLGGRPGPPWPFRLDRAPDDGDAAGTDEVEATLARYGELTRAAMRERCSPATGPVPDRPGARLPFPAGGQGSGPSLAGHLPGLRRVGARGHGSGRGHRDAAQRVPDPRRHRGRQSRSAGDGRPCTGCTASRWP